MKNLPQRTREQAQALQRIKDAAMDDIYVAASAYLAGFGIVDQNFEKTLFAPFTKDVLWIEQNHDTHNTRCFVDKVSKLAIFQGLKGKELEKNFSKVLAVLEVYCVLGKNENITSHKNARDNIEDYSRKLFVCFTNLKNFRISPSVIQYFIAQGFGVKNLSDPEECQKSIEEHVERQLQQLKAPEQPHLQPEVENIPDHSEDRFPAENFVIHDTYTSYNSTYSTNPKHTKSLNKASWRNGALVGSGFATSLVIGVYIGNANAYTYIELVEALNYNKIAANAVIIVGAGVLITVGGALGAGVQKSMGG